MDKVAGVLLLIPMQGQEGHTWSNISGTAAAGLGVRLKKKMFLGGFSVSEHALNTEAGHWSSTLTV